MQTSNEDLLKQIEDLQQQVITLKQANTVHTKQQSYLTTLHETALTLMQRLELDDLLEGIISSAARLAQTEHGFVYLLEPDEKSMRARAMLGMFKPYLNNHITPEQQGMVNEVWHSGEHVVIYDYDNWHRRLKTSQKNLFYVGAAFPLLSGEKVTGVIALAYEEKDRRFTEETLQMLNGFANLASIALDNAHLYNQLKESQGFINGILKHIPALVTVFNQQTEHFDYVNESVENMLGYAPQDVISQPDYYRNEVIHPDDRHLMEQSSERLMLGADVTVTSYRVRHINGTWRWLQTHETILTSDQQGRIIQTLSISQDITEQKEAEQQALALKLEKERIKVLAKFVQDAGHDLRTPLSTINTSVYLLERMRQDEDNHQRHAEVIKEQVYHLNRLVDGLLTMSRLDSFTELAKNPVNIVQLIEDIQVDATRIVRRRNQWLQTRVQRPLPMVRGDSNELHRAIMHIIDNASTYSPHETRILLTATQQGDEIRINIEDHGIGIDPEDMPYIYDRFYRADKARSISGAGLGLSIVKTIVDYHNGRIEVTNKPDTGTNVSIYLPSEL